MVITRKAAAASHLCWSALGRTEGASAFLGRFHAEGAEERRGRSELRGASLRASSLHRSFLVFQFKRVGCVHVSSRAHGSAGNSKRMAASRAQSDDAGVVPAPSALPCALCVKPAAVSPKSYPILRRSKRPPFASSGSQRSPTSRSRAGTFAMWKSSMRTPRSSSSQVTGVDTVARGVGRML
jgi:hypothetical protein